MADPLEWFMSPSPSTRCQSQKSQKSFETPTKPVTPSGKPVVNEMKPTPSLPTIAQGLTALLAKADDEILRELFGLRREELERLARLASAAEQGITAATIAASGGPATVATGRGGPATPPEPVATVAAPPRPVASPKERTLAEMAADVQRTWNVVKLSPLETTGVAFFLKIFELAPAALELFPSFRDAPELSSSPQLKSHALKVMQTVDVAVQGLGDVGALVPVLRGLGKEHVKYGVRPEHYDVVGAALLATLEGGLGAAWTRRVSEAWAAVFELVATTMIGDHYVEDDATVSNGQANGHAQGAPPVATPATPDRPVATSARMPPIRERTLAEMAADVQRTWSVVKLSPLEPTGVAFFLKIFELAPAALALFPSFRDAPELSSSPQLKSHALKVMQTVDVAVQGLGDVGALVPVLRGLGAKHLEYGVRPEHYDVVGAALLATLEGGLGAAWTPRVSEAWAAVYELVATTMIGDNYA